MYNVDTISLSVSFRRYKEDGIRQIDWAYVQDINKKLMQKLYLDKDNKAKRELEYNKIALSKEAKEFYTDITNKMFKSRSIYWKGTYNGYVFNYNETWNNLNVMLTHEKVEQYTADEILFNVKDVLKQHFGLQDSDVENIVLNRLDIKNDYKFKDSVELDIIKNIVEKATDKVRSCTKEILQDDNDGYTVRYIAKYNEDTDNENNICDRKSSNYTETVIYDKGKQMQINVKDGKATQEDAEKYKNIIRVELRIKNGRLNSEKSINGQSKELVNYYNEDTTKEYFGKYIAQIFGNNGFYRIDVALDIINNSNDITSNIKQKLCTLLEDVNKNGYTMAEKKYCKTTFLSYKKKIEQLGINILTFDTTINGIKVKEKSINNFTLLK